MSNAVPVSDLTLDQLKQWLATLNMPTNGSRNELVLRLYSVPVETRGHAPPGWNEHDNSEHNLDDIQLMRPNPDQLNEASIPRSVQQEAVNSNFNNNNDVAVVQQLLQQLQLLIPRIEHGHDLGRSFQNLENNGNATGIVIDNNVANENIDDSTIPINGNATVEATNQYSGNSNGESMGIAFSLAKEVLLDFNGESCPKKWVAQLKNIGEVYNIGNTHLRMLFICKMKSKAHSWLHSEVTRIREPVAVLCEQLMAAFGEKMSKSQMRRHFEQRNWKFGEKFAVYLDDKLMLANNINIDEEELLDKVIEGIPDKGLRTQARIQCFANPKQMLAAFAEIHLEDIRRATKDENETGRANKLQEMRCRRCNIRGHLVKDCNRPDRVPGSCVICGSMEHWAAKCPDRKGSHETNGLNRTNQSSNNFIRGVQFP
ncbi:uncharacterized protein LOC124459709 isoform X3 [Drosophila willistoni]|uniref:uncharacterized protein LOC124459709 isoform X3 n=1 Tax=Drosophila willistoni TaxID=7260 RepID=UPI001F085EE2|nr:uncharacterized protein LOC124459709 isoform X3 [Drosophila willistoni]